MELGRKRSHPVGTCVMGGDSEEKRDYMGRDPPQRIQTDVGSLPSWILHRESEPPWLVGEPVGLTERLWKAWTPLFRNTCTLACSWINKKEDWKLHKWLASFPRLPPPSSPRLVFQPEPGEHSSSACFKMQLHVYIFHTFFSRFSFWDPYNVNASTLILTYRAFKLFSV